MAQSKQPVKVNITNAESDVYISSENALIEGDRLILRSRHFEAVPHHIPVDIVVYYEDGVQAMWGLVTLSMSTQINIEIVSVQGAKQDRRFNLKVRTSFDAWVTQLVSAGPKQKRMRGNFSVRIRDLSLGGTGFFSNRKLFLRQGILMNFDYIKKGFRTECRIIRKEFISPLNDSLDAVAVGFRYRYGCRILGLSAEEERLVCEYVFKVQLAEHHRRKESS